MATGLRPVAILIELPGILKRPFSFLTPLKFLGLKVSMVLLKCILHLIVRSVAFLVFITPC